MRQRRSFELLQALTLTKKTAETVSKEKAAATSVTTTSSTTTATTTATTAEESKTEEVKTETEKKEGDVEEQKKTQEPSVEPKEWQPTEEWLQGIKAKFPLESCLKVIHSLYPKVEQYSAENGVDEEEPILEFLATHTMVGLLPMPKQIIVKKFQDNKHTHAWFTSHIWGVIFVRTHRNIPFDKSAIKLFTLNTVQEE
eukprot:CAMPEP_0115001726 /NCGR_PEP_ID=MMETSP0216-20121206/17566_1 /TAXON_ID=223996 /ORGANISM="Protocruzia adherens, Strain Boccale" /LENGTH=197 /DNA_ID=CAMNT_0002367153 /DNA_START=496 /DNA_END=1089 /DNA_ORIENTATION=+